jgi:hypothetical protein
MKDELNPDLKEQSEWTPEKGKPLSPQEVDDIYAKQDFGGLDGFSDNGTLQRNIAKKQWEQEVARAAIPAPTTEHDYLVVAFQSWSQPTVGWARDAAEMQKQVEGFRARGTYQHIAVFKRMLLMKSKTEWETIQVDA